MGNGSSKQKTIIPGVNKETIASSPMSSQTAPPPAPAPAAAVAQVVARVAPAASPGPKKFKETYTVSKDLGSGAFSVVKLATHKVSGKSTAVKIIAKKKLSDEDLTALMTEISILREMDHPHIIKCYETYDEGSEFYIVTELVAGGELFDRIVAKTHYTEKEARDLVKMFLETMAYMHEAGVVHRDLKPENLLLCSETDDSDIKIADFGFAKKTSSLLPNESACGTPGYVAPEILRGDRYGCEVDIWSMGVICYVLLAGYPPFYDEDQKKLFRKIKEGKYHFHQDYWCNTSPDAIDMIKRMLCVNQAERWTARKLLSHPWITAGDEELRSKDLSKSIEAMKKYKAKMRFKAVTNAIIMTNRMKGAFKIKSMGQMVAPGAEAFTPIAESSSVDELKLESSVKLTEDSVKGDAAAISVTEPATPNPEPADGAEKECESQAKARAAAQRMKSKGQIVLNHAASDDSNDHEDDLSHLTACID